MWEAGKQKRQAVLCYTPSAVVEAGCRSAKYFFADEQPENQRANEEHKEQDEQDLRDGCGGASNPAKPEQSSHDRDDEEQQCKP